MNNIIVITAFLVILSVSLIMSTTLLSRDTLHIGLDGFLSSKETLQIGQTPLQIKQAPPFETKTQIEQVSLQSEQTLHVSEETLIEQVPSLETRKTKSTLRKKPISVFSL